MIVTIEDAVQIYDAASKLCRDTIQIVEEKRTTARKEREKWGKWDRFVNKYWLTDYFTTDEYFDNQLYLLNRELNGYQNKLAIIEYQNSHFEYTQFEVPEQLFLAHQSVL